MLTPVVADGTCSRQPTGPALESTFCSPRVIVILSSTCGNQIRCTFSRQHSRKAASRQFLHVPIRISAPSTRFAFPVVRLDMTVPGAVQDHRVTVLQLVFAWRARQCIMWPTIEVAVITQISHNDKMQSTKFLRLRGGGREREV